MTCQNCVRQVREALERVPGVRSAAVSLPNERASIQWQHESAPDTAALLETLKEAGYSGRVVDAEPGGVAHGAECHSAAWELNLWIGVAGIVLALPFTFGLENGSFDCRTERGSVGHRSRLQP